MVAAPMTPRMSLRVGLDGRFHTASRAASTDNSLATFASAGIVSGGLTLALRSMLAGGALLGVHALVLGPLPIGAVPTYRPWIDGIQWAPAHAAPRRQCQTQKEIAMSTIGPATFAPVPYEGLTCAYLESAYRSASHPSSHDLVETPATNSLAVTKMTDASSHSFKFVQARLGNFEIQRLMSQYNQAETLSSNVQKKLDDTKSGQQQKIG